MNKYFYFILFMCFNVVLNCSTYVKIDDQRVKSFELYNSNNALIRNIHFNYDQNGNILLMTYYDDQQKITRIDEFIYNNNGTIRINSLNSNKEITKFSILFFSENGREESQTTYDEKNNFIFREIMEYDNSIPIKRIKYDNKGNIIDFAKIVFINPLEISYEIYKKDNSCKVKLFVNYNENKIPTKMTILDCSNNKINDINVQIEKGILSKRSKRYYYF